MKTKLTSLLTGCLLVLTFNQSFSQEYEYVPMPTSNAIWSEMLYYYGFHDFYPNDTMNVKYALFDEDTILYEKTWQKLYMVFDSIPTKKNAILNGFIMEENKVVYYIGENSGGILYDFNAKVGDTLNLINAEFVPVYKIDTVLVGSTLRKRFFLWWEDSGLVWIEGIGSLKGILTSDDWPLDRKPELLCFKHNDEIIYYNDLYGTCYPDYPNMYNTLKETKQNEDLIIFPNPCYNSLNIKSDNNKGGIIKIISYDGKLQFEKSIQPAKEISINTENLMDGIYLLIYINTENKIYEHKFIKTHN
jgi:hypothetical protein